MHKFDEKQHQWSSRYFARVAYMNCKQAPDQTNSDYLDQFRATVEVLEYYNINISDSAELLTEDTYANMTDNEKIKAARERTLATTFLHNSDHVRYAPLIADLNNQYIRGNDQFPCDLTTAYSLIVNYNPPITTARHQPSSPTSAPFPSTTVSSTTTARRPA